MTNQTPTNLTAPPSGDSLPATLPPAPGPPGSKKRNRFWRVVRNRSTFAGGLIVAIIVLVALVSLFWTPHSYSEQDLNASLLPPFWMTGADPAYPLGTDL